MVFISTNELLLTSKASKGCLVFQNTTKGLIPKGNRQECTAYLGQFEPVQLHLQGTGQNEFTGKPAGGGSGGGQGMKDKTFSCTSNSSLEPVPALTTATCCSHAVPPSVPWLQVSGATCTWVTFKPRIAYRESKEKC